MTYASDEVRNRFHRLATALQFEVESLAQQFASRLIFLHIEEVTEDSEVIIRINEKFVNRTAERVD